MSKVGIGKTLWIVPGGHIPLQSTGHEPEFTSNDKISLLNTNLQETEVKITIYYDDEDPVGPYTCKVAGQRVRKIRINDLMDPLPIFLDRPYAITIQSDLPLVVQFSRQSTEQRRLALAGSLAFAEKENAPL